MHSAPGSLRLLGAIVLACVACLLACGLVACSGTEDAASGSQATGRGSILAADGTVFASTQDATRSYPLGAVASPLVGSLYTQGAPDGVEQAYDEQLSAGQDVQLTIDPAIQQAAYDALGPLKGAIVVLDPQTGEVLALVSTPAYDPALEQGDEAALKNNATRQHIPGSTFKTITLAAALESGNFTMDTVMPAPASLTFSGGSVNNYDMMEYPEQTLMQAYTKSINTVFAQLTMAVGFQNVRAMAERFGFEAPILDDYPIDYSLMAAADEMEMLMQAWSGVGQALFQDDGQLQGPMMTAVQGASIAATVKQGGAFVRPHIVARVGDEEVPAAGEAHSIISEDTAGQIAQGMRSVVAEGTGRSAAVEGVDMGGKTGTAETADGTDDGWFIGFAEKDGRCLAFCVLVEESQSSEAAATAAVMIQSLFVG